MRSAIAWLTLLLIPTAALIEAQEIAPPVRAKGAEPLYRIKEDKAWGYINADGSVAITPQFDWAGDFFEGLAFATRGETRGYINRSGHFELVLPERIFEHFRDGIAWVGGPLDHNRRSSNRGRLIDRNGQSLRLPEGFRFVGPFSEGLAAVVEETVANGQVRTKYGFANKSGTVVIPARFDAVYDFSDGIAPVAIFVPGSSDPRFPLIKWGLIDSSGTLILPTEYDDLRTSGGYGTITFWLSSIRRMGLTDRSGKVVVPARYLLIQDYGDGDTVKIFIAAVSGGDNYELLRPDGSLVIELINTRVSRFSEGLARIESGQQVGFIDEHGVTTIPLRFEDASDFSEGLAAAKSGLWGYINKRGDWVITPQFDEALEFRGPLALVARGDAWHYIDTAGRVIRTNAWIGPSE